MQTAKATWSHQVKVTLKQFKFIKMFSFMFFALFTPFQSANHWSLWFLQSTKTDKSTYDDHDIVFTNLWNMEKKICLKQCIKIKCVRYLNGGKRVLFDGFWFSVMWFKLDDYSSCFVVIFRMSSSFRFRWLELFRSLQLDILRR